MVGDLRYRAKRSQAVQILCVGVSGGIAVLSVPFGINLYGLRGLWIPLVLVIPMSLQCLAARLLRDLIQSRPE